MEQSHDFYAVMQKLGRPVVYYPRVCQAFDDDLRCGVFLSNFSYWEGKQSDPDGWIYKSQSDIKNETGLGRYAQEQARKKLKELGVLQELLKGKPPVLHYKFDWSKMNEVLNKHFAGQKQEKLDIEAQDPLLYRMKVIFSEEYLKQTKEHEFEWGKGKASGKYWKGLKDLSETFRGRIISKKKKENPSDNNEATDDEIISSFKHFLSLLPTYVKEKFFAPHLIYSKFPEILSEIVSNGNKVNTQRQSTASDYV